jgi:hypothetical protein
MGVLLGYIFIKKKKISYKIKRCRGARSKKPRNMAKKPCTLFQKKKVQSRKKRVQNPIFRKNFTKNQKIKNFTKIALKIFRAKKCKKYIKIP